MKKVLLTMLGVVGMLCSTSCSDEEIVSNVEGDAVAEFTVELSDGSDASRAISDGLSVDELYYEVYSVKDGVATLMSNLDAKVDMDVVDGVNTATVRLALVKGQAYDVVFWAQTPGAYDATDLRNITVAPTTANNEDKDAFTAVYRTAKVTGPIKETIVLTRPFAQVNFGTLDVEAAKKAGITFSESRIVVSNAANTYNALTEQAAATGSELTFGFAKVPDMDKEALVVGTQSYEYLATAYVLVPGDSTQKLSDLKMEIKTDLNENITLSVPNAPVQRNYRTNVLGNLLTNQAEFNIVVDPIYKGDYVENVDKTETVSTAAELQAAIDAAIVGNNVITFGADINGDVTVIQKEGINIVINGADYKYDGKITVNGNGRSAGTETLTFNEINFSTTHATDTKDSEWQFISAPSKIGSKNNYSHNVTINNCTFENTVAGVLRVGGAGFTGTYNLVMKNCTATNMHSILQAQSCDNTVVVDNITITNCKNGVSFGNTAYPTLKNSTIKAVAYGVRGDGNASRGNLVIENTTINAAKPVIIRKMTTDSYTVKLDATTVLAGAEKYDVAFTEGDDEAEYATPTGTWSIEGADGYVVYPNTVVVNDWNDFTAALAGSMTETILLTSDITYDKSYDLTKNVTIDLNEKSLEISDPSLALNLKSNATIKNGTIKGKVYAQKNSNIIFDGVTFGGSINGVSQEGLLQIQGACDVYAVNCKFNATNTNATKSRPLSVEGRSSGVLKFENCEFKSNLNQNQVYVNPMSGTATLDFTNCNFNNKTPNIMFAATYPLSNLTMTGTTKLSSVTLEIQRAKESVTEADWAHISSLIANNSFSSVRVFYNPSTSEYISQ